MDRDFYAEIRSIAEEWIEAEDLATVSEELEDLIQNLEE